MQRRVKSRVYGVLLCGLISMIVALTPGCKIGSSLFASYDSGTNTLQIVAVGGLEGACQLLSSIPLPQFLCRIFSPNLQVASIFSVVPDALSALLVIRDPLVVQVPVGVTNIAGTYLNTLDPTDTGPLVITTGLTSLAIDATQTLDAEPGMQIVVFDLPASIGATGTFIFTLSVTPPPGTNALPIKAIITGRLDLAGQTFYPPVLPCVTAFASVPALIIPLQDGLVPVSLSGLPGCDNITYNFDAAAPAPAPVPTPIPTLPQWGMILLTLSLLTMATWQLAGRPVLFGGGASGRVGRLPRHQWLTSLLLGQGTATLGLGLYAVLVGPLVPHDGLGALLSGLLIGVMVEGYRRGRSL